MRKSSPGPRLLSMSELWAVVVTVIVTIAPDGAGFGLNVAVEPCGRPVADSITILEKLLVDEVIIIVN